jgi:hypothetical protein
MKSMISACCLIFALTSMVLAQEKVEAPVWNVGDKWTYKDAAGETWTNEVAKVEEDLFIIKSSRSQDLVAYDRKTLNGAFLIDESGRRQKNTSTFRKLYDFPLFVGKKWTDATASAALRSGEQANFVHDFKVDGVEKITTPAGTFNTYRIHYKQTNMRAGNGWVRYWYSPEVKIWVRREFEKSSFWPNAQWTRDAQLVSYELK